MAKTAEEKRLARNEYMREYRKKNKEKINEQRKKWLDNNRLKHAEFQARYWGKQVQELKAASSEGVSE